MVGYEQREEGGRVEEREKRKGKRKRMSVSTAFRTHRRFPRACLFGFSPGRTGVLSGYLLMPEELGTV